MGYRGLDDSEPAYDSEPAFDPEEGEGAALSDDEAADAAASDAAWGNGSWPGDEPRAFWCFAASIRNLSASHASRHQSANVLERALVMRSAASDAGSAQWAPTGAVTEEDDKPATEHEARMPTPSKGARRTPS